MKRLIAVLVATLSSIPHAAEVNSTASIERAKSPFDVDIAKKIDELIFGQAKILSDGKPLPKESCSDVSKPSVRCDIDVTVTATAGLCVAEITGVLNIPQRAKKVTVVWSIKSATPGFFFPEGVGITILQDKKNQFKDKSHGIGDNDAHKDSDKYFREHKNDPKSEKSMPLEYIPLVMGVINGRKTLCQAVDPVITNDGQ